MLNKKGEKFIKNLLSATEFLKKKCLILFLRPSFYLKVTKIYMSSPNQTIRSLCNEGGNNNFWRAIHRGLNVAADILSRVLY